MSLATDRALDAESWLENSPRPLKSGFKFDRVHYEWNFYVF